MLTSGVVVAGSYDKLKDRVFRIGHMGSQANLPMLRTALSRLEDALAELKHS